MKKKILIILYSIILSFNTAALDFHSSKEYVQTNRIIHNVPNIMDFFSFFCPYCYEFEKIHHEQSFTKKTFKNNIHILLCT